MYKKHQDIVNPIQTNGFDFIEFATKSPQQLIHIFTKFGFVITRRHHSKNILLLEQGEIKFIVNAEPNTDGSAFEAVHGSGICGISFRVENSEFAIKETEIRGAKVVTDNDYGLPAIAGVGGSKIYLIDSKTSNSFFEDFFEITGKSPLAQPIVTYIDHITHNLFPGNMEAWGKFYEQVFNFREIRCFDIKGKKTALRSKAIISPCDKIRIPLNESQDELSQIAEFLHQYNGEGIQHIALGCQDIFNAVNRIKEQGIIFQDTPENYYNFVNQRVPNHQEDLAALKELNILIDGGEAEGDGVLLQIFTKEIIGPIFFEFIERKGNEGFGEGNFQALFECIELDQIRRGVIEDGNKLKHPMLLTNKSANAKISREKSLSNI